MHQYLGDRDPRDPLASPLYADLSAMPLLMIHVGENEVLLDDSVKLAQRACLAGTAAVLKIWPVVHHGWQLAPFIPEARQSANEACDFLISAIEGRQAARVGTNQLRWLNSGWRP